MGTQQHVATHPRAGWIAAESLASQIGMIDSRIRAAATTLTTGAWLGRNRFW